jgi:succinate-semialdehyde dehydrogenase/glutarate-semialdehyde dehydrogenase
MTSVTLNDEVEVRTGLFIGGQWRASSDGTTLPVDDPATGAHLGDVASATPQDAIAAVDAAHAAFGPWAARSPRERSEILRRAWELMQERFDDLATVIAMEGGKGWDDAAGEVRYASEFFRWFAEEAVRANGQYGMSPGGDKRIVSLYQPIGVSVLVTPWNFPAAMATRKIAPALAAGCSVVLKPASDTPLTALLLAELLSEAGVPDGVVNVLPSTSAGRTVGAMLDDPRVKALSFTGSTEVGRILLRGAAEQVLKCSMELGGNAPFLIFDDADVDAAVEEAMIAKMRNGGESCIAANRFHVQRGIADEFTRKLAERMGALKVGSGLQPGTDVGPLINAGACEDVHAMVEEAVAAGARVVTGGQRGSDGPSYYEPTVLTDVAPGNPILDKEIFGPVAPIVPFDTDDEGIEAANATIFGLAAYVFAGDRGRAMRAAERVDAGMIGVNRGLISDPAAPFGGVKQSGLGREGGHEGIAEFMEMKYIAVDW